MIYCCVYRCIKNSIFVAKELVYVKNVEEQKILLGSDKQVNAQGCEKNILEMDNLDFTERIDAITKKNIGNIAIIRENVSKGTETYSKYDLTIKDVEEYLKRGCEVILLNLTIGAMSKFPNVTMRKIFTLKEHMKNDL